MRIAIIGWGSLLWDEVPSFDSLHGPWSFDGPVLPIEFSRVSAKRPGALTLVIDETAGAPCRTAWALSHRRSTAKAIEDLRRREQAPAEAIGVWTAAGDRRMASPVPATIEPFARERDLDAVVWTGLSANFAERRGCSFSVAAAIDHLRSLSPVEAPEAERYIRLAPALVRTPLRDAVEADPTIFAGLARPPAPRAR